DDGLSEQDLGIGNNPFMLLHQRYPSHPHSGRNSFPTLSILPTQRKPVKPAGAPNRGTGTSLRSRRRRFIFTCRDAFRV
ncbi:MAG: hypothetical protein Q8O44_00005, partial [Syntrophales bacterium]|nr:hypothetical protein [Syntrophales bacterium]